MKLFQYDHCPFCVRADMVAKYKQVNFESVYLLNDDADSCIERVGKKMVPILEIDGQSMGESLDIAHKLDELGSADQVIVEGGDSDRFTQPLMSVNRAIFSLLFPRNVQIGLPEFETQSAIDFYRVNKEAMIECSFEQALDNTAEHQALVEQVLNDLPKLTKPSDRGGQLSWDDVMIFPMLRNLTVIKDLQMPTQVVDYINEVAQLTNVELYTDRAI
ncbi:glutaredoxin 2 [Marinobacterium sp. xm-a-152]|uniref:glutaredoxin 2 n=1 Tax=Marinobacterium sp. xm-a-152 TaxID=2497733 RepID=UPI00156A5AF6|nr:glutaredoxin 2 [Marinobacterium sp. xm-a-152]NRP15705.1 Glutaredoxin-2 [Marinobacterium sp. xm-a-152]